jgi:YqjK-like protein
VNSNESMTQILLERERLVTRCAAQRMELAELSTKLERPLRFADRVIEVIATVRAHPALFGAAVAVLVALRHRGMWRWARRGYTLWRAYRTFGRAGLGI